MAAKPRSFCVVLEVLRMLSFGVKLMIFLTYIFKLFLFFRFALHYG